jgi:hypothetical protein
MKYFVDEFVCGNLDNFPKHADIYSCLFAKYIWALSPVLAVKFNISPYRWQPFWLVPAEILGKTDRNKWDTACGNFKTFVFLIYHYKMVLVLFHYQNNFKLNSCFLHLCYLVVTSAGSKLQPFYRLREWEYHRVRRRIERSQRNLLSRSPGTVRRLPELGAKGGKTTTIKKYLLYLSESRCHVDQRSFPCVFQKNA